MSCLRLDVQGLSWELNTTLPCHYGSDYGSKWCHKQKMATLTLLHILAFWQRVHLSLCQCWLLTKVPDWSVFSFLIRIFYETTQTLLTVVRLRQKIEQ